MNEREPERAPVGVWRQVAGYRACTAVLERFRLDGGAMFGSVPRVLWERSAPPDERNRIGLAARVLVLEGAGRLAIVDAGVGDKFGPKEAEMFAVELVPPDRLPFRWQDLTDILLTHLHFDHAGGATVWDAPAGDAQAPRRAKLRVPGARIHLGRANWDRARAPGVRERASYLAENVDPLERGDLRLSDGPTEVLPEVRTFTSDGHTRGLHWVLVGGGRDGLAFPADLVPTSAHVHLPFVMGYDMCVETLLGEKEEFLRKAAEEGWIVVFAHDEKVPAARIVRTADGRYRLGDVVQI